MDIPSIQTTYFPLTGGLNLVTPPLSLKDGLCRDAVNFECDVDGGYRRVAGYERFDGQTEPSSITYYALPISSFSDTVANGDIITGVTSAETATVLASDDDNIYITKASGAFESSGEVLNVSGSPVAISSASQNAGGAPTSALDATYTNLAADIYRALITAVPGSGSILGVWMYNDIVYAFRNNAGGTAAAMYKSTSSGWSLVNLNNEISFTNANTDVGDGDTLTQGGVTATILRVVVETGTLQSGTNTGRLIIGAPTGGNFTAGAATSTGSGALTLSGAESAITLAVGGRYEFVNHNFGGSSGTFRMYGASGTNKLFEFDGTVYVPITTGLPVDTPNHIAVHLNYLITTYDSSLQRSSIGAPYMWTVITGAAELAVGESVTQILPIVGSNNSAAMAVFTRNKTMMLYGSTEADLQLVTFSLEAGAAAYTGQNIGDVYVLDQQGVRQMSGSDTFGNFSDVQITRFIKPWIAARTGKAVASCISRDRSQYRLFFNDKYVLHITFDNGRIVGMMPILLEHTFNCVSSHEVISTGEEYILAGGTDGYVYRLDKGTSFDGANINSFISLVFSYMKSPRVRKNFKKAVYEITGGGYSEIDASYELGYGSADINQGVTSMLASAAGSVFWDSFIWDSFYWDGRTLLPIEHKLFGTAENISLILRCDSQDFEPFTINSALIHHIPRRQKR